VSNPSKRRGTEWETAGVRYLRENVPASDDIRRVAQTGRLDIGDAHARPFALEFKNVAKIDLASFVAQADREAENAGMPYGAAIVKRRGKGPAHAYAVMSLETFSRVLARLREHPGDFGAVTPP
jgi:hypothetical protein